MNESEFSLPNPVSGSFRDPAGRLLAIHGRMIRIITSSGILDFKSFLASKTAQDFFSSGRLIRTRILEDGETQRLLDSPEIKSWFSISDIGTVAEHAKVPFPSFPYEWPPEMLYEAASLTLDLAEALLSEGLGLKDATPYNILFQGSKATFIDLLSFERRDPGDPTWLPYAQCVRTFLLPLLINKYFGIPIDQVLSTRRDGVEPEQAYRLCRPLQKIRQPFLTLVTIPTWLVARHNPDDQAVYKKKSLSDTEKARFILKHLFRSLRRRLMDVAPKVSKRSVWSDYMLSNNNYSEGHFKAKQAFVERIIAEFHPRKVLDIGCNTGHFSTIAARSGSSVVAIDYDPVVVGDVWRKASAEGLDILPLVVNLSRPSPGIGWNNQECLSFLNRARGTFDCVLMLAVIHHMLVSERIPLQEIIDLAAELTTNFLVIEFIAPYDSMFQRLTRGRDGLFKHLTPEFFVVTCQRHFEIICSQHLGHTSRWLYLMRKK